MPTQSRGDATRSRILEGAGITFSDLGYTAATFDRIAKAADVKLGSVYFHFKTKQLLAEAVVAEQHARAVDIIAREGADDLSAAEALVTASLEMAELILADPVVRAGMRLSLEDSALSSPSLPFYAEWARLVSLLVQRGIDAGEFANDLPADDIASALIGCFTGAHLLSNARSQRRDLHDQLRTMWRLLLVGLAPDSSPEPALAILARAFASDPRS